METQQLQRRQRRLNRYQQVIDLLEKGYSRRVILRTRSAVNSIFSGRLFVAGCALVSSRNVNGPAAEAKRSPISMITSRQRWDEGCHNAMRLLHEIRDRGYRGCRSMAAKFVAGWRHTGRPSGKLNAPERIAPKHAAILAARPPDQMTDEQQTLLDRLLCVCPDIIRLRDLALGFRDALKGHEGAVLQKWTNEVKHCEFGPLVRFLIWTAKGPFGGYCSRRDAMEQRSGGRAGQRLKAIKRQMYGRAGFNLLRARVLSYPLLGMLTATRHEVAKLRKNPIQSSQITAGLGP